METETDIVCIGILLGNSDSELKELNFSEVSSVFDRLETKLRQSIDNVEIQVISYTVDIK